MMMAAVVYKDLQSLPCAADQVIGEAGGLVSPHLGGWGGGGWVGGGWGGLTWWGLGGPHARSS